MDLVGAEKVIYIVERQSPWVQAKSSLKVLCLESRSVVTARNGFRIK